MRKEKAFMCLLCLFLPKFLFMFISIFKVLLKTIKDLVTIKNLETIEDLETIESLD